MIGWLNPTTWLVALALLAGAYGTGRWQQWRADQRESVAAQLEAEKKARQDEQALRNDMEVLKDARDQELRAVAAQRDAALRELRNRPDRLPPAAAPSCAGTTGAELSRPDAEFLAGFAARADELRVELGKCQQRERAVFEALTGGGEQ